jgi:Na+/H+ antiporter NhaD/arsenite permease-like protein
MLQSSAAISELFLTPIGALAGMMWMGLLKSHEVKFTFLRFLKLGVLPSLIALGAALFGLFIVLL